MSYCKGEYGLKLKNISSFHRNLFEDHKGVQKKKSFLFVFAIKSFLKGSLTHRHCSVFFFLNITLKKARYKSHWISWNSSIAEKPFLKINALSKQESQ